MARTKVSAESGRAALGEGPDLGQAGHGGVTGVRGQQCAVGPAQADCLLEGCSGQEAVEEARRETVATADAVEDVELHHRGLVERAVGPDHRTPAVAGRGVDLAQGGGHELHVGEAFDDLLDHIDEGTRVESGCPVALGSADAKGELYVLLVADQDIDVADKLGCHFLSPRVAAPRTPELGPVVEIEAHDRT